MGDERLTTELIAHSAHDSTSTAGFCYSGRPDFPQSKQLRRRLKSQRVSSSATTRLFRGLSPAPTRTTVWVGKLSPVRAVNFSSRECVPNDERVKPYLPGGKENLEAGGKFLICRNQYFVGPRDARRGPGS